MRNTLIVAVFLLHSSTAVAGDWGLDAVWTPSVVAMGESAFVVKNVLRYEDPENRVGPDYLECFYPKAVFSTPRGLTQSVVLGVEYAICPYVSAAPNIKKPSEEPAEPAKRIESGFAHCERVVVHAPALKESECTAEDDALAAMARLKSALAKRELTLGDDIRSYPTSEAPTDLLNAHGYPRTTLYAGRVWKGAMCGVQIKGPGSSATLIKASANGSCGGYRAEVAVSSDWKKVVALVKNYEWTTATGWKTKDLAAIVRRLEQSPTD
ncbi:MAG: hypothetical protein AAFQ82_24620 [Myxococcota bacterium]